MDSSLMSGSSEFHTFHTLTPTLLFTDFQPGHLEGTI